MIHLVFSFPYAQCAFLFLSLLFASFDYWKKHQTVGWKMFQPWALLNRKEPNNIWTILAFISFILAILLTLVYFFYAWSFSKM